MLWHFFFSCGDKHVNVQCSFNDYFLKKNKTKWNETKQQIEDILE